MAKAEPNRHNDLTDEHTNSTSRDAKDDAEQDGKDDKRENLSARSSERMDPSGMMAMTDMFGSNICWAHTVMGGQSCWSTLVRRAWLGATMTVVPECVETFGAEALDLMSRRLCVGLSFANSRFELVDNAAHDGIALSVGRVLIRWLGINGDQNQLRSLVSMLVRLT